VLLLVFRFGLVKEAQKMIEICVLKSLLMDLFLIPWLFPAMGIVVVLIELSLSRVVQHQQPGLLMCDNGVTS